MRAIYDEALCLGRSQVSIENKEDLVHLTKVLRVKEGDKLLLLNGEGMKFMYEVSFIQKREIVLNFTDKEECSRENDITVILGSPKKEYFEDCLRTFVQLGVSKLILIQAKNSHYCPDTSSARIKRILKNSYEQSNNPFALTIESPVDLAKFDFAEFQEIEEKYILTLNKGNSSQEGLTASEFIMVLGPEGGFESSEEDLFFQNNFKPMRLPFPILKTTAAASAGIAYLCGTLRN